MASVMAIVAKAVFEKQARGLGIGDVWPTDRYASKTKALDNVAGGGSLFLVTVRPPEELWLVGILEAPVHDGEVWVADANATPIRAIGKLLRELVLEHGDGITYAKGKLGMSLQSPRVLADSDAALLRGATKSSKAAAKSAPKALAKRATATAKPAPKVPATRAKTAKPAPKVPAKRVAEVPAKPAAKSPMKATARVSIAAAGSRLAKGKPVDALTELIAQWKTARAPAIADAIDKLSIHAAKATAPKKQLAWDRAAKDAGPGDLGRLLDTLGEGADVDRVVTRLRKLAKQFPGDPRLARFAHVCLDDLAYTATSSRHVWSQLFDMLEEIGDPRTAAVIAANRARWDKKLEKRGNYHDHFLTRLDALAEAAAAIPIANVSRDALAPFLAIEHTPSADESELAALFEQVYRNPADDAAILVLQDALLEAGHPRGELIQLQLAAATRKLSTAERARETQLLAKHGREWLGAVGEFASTSDLIYERGFPIHLRLVRPTTKQGRFPVDAPETATIRSVAIGPSVAVAETSSWIRSFPNLRRIELPMFKRLAAVIEDGPLAVEEIATKVIGNGKWITRANFPKLAKLEMIWTKKVVATTADWFAKKSR